MAHLQESRFLGYWGLYRRGVIMNITNPKVTLFFLAFLPQFCAPERGSVALQVMELGLLFMLAAFLVLTAVSALGGRLAHWFNSSPRGQMLMHRVARSGLRGPGRDADLFLRGLSRAKGL